MAKKTSEAPEPQGSFKRLISHDDKPNFWKPIRSGEKIMGKLVAITTTQNGKALQISLFHGGIQSVGVNCQLARVPWEEIVGKEISIEYVRSVKTKYPTEARLFNVEVAE